MALYTSQGTITEIGEVKSGVSQKGNHWQRTSIILEVPSFGGSVIKQKFDATGDIVDDVMQYKVGDKVTLSWSMYAREYNGRMYNNVDIVKVVADESQRMSVKSASAKKTQAPAAPQIEEEKDDLPF